MKVKVSELIFVAGDDDNYLGFSFRLLDGDNVVWNWSGAAEPYRSTGKWGVTKGQVISTPIPDIEADTLRVGYLNFTSPNHKLIVVSDREREYSLPVTPPERLEVDYWTYTIIDISRTFPALPLIGAGLLVGLGIVLASRKRA